MSDKKQKLHPKPFKGITDGGREFKTSKWIHNLRKEWVQSIPVMQGFFCIGFIHQVHTVYRINQ